MLLKKCKLKAYFSIGTGDGAGTEAGEKKKPWAGGAGAGEKIDRLRKTASHYVPVFFIR